MCLACSLCVCNHDMHLIHAWLQMPTGTGKTITLLSLITSYQLQHAEIGAQVQLQALLLHAFIHDIEKNRLRNSPDSLLRLQASSSTVRALCQRWRRCWQSCRSSVTIVPSTSWGQASRSLRFWPWG